jgi:hypothetical protein
MRNTICIFVIPRPRWNHIAASVSMPGGCTESSVNAQPIDSRLLALDDCLLIHGFLPAFVSIFKVARREPRSSCESDRRVSPLDLGGRAHGRIWRESERRRRIDFMGAKLGICGAPLQVRHEMPWPLMLLRTRGGGGSTGAT